MGYERLKVHVDRFYKPEKQVCPGKGPIEKFYKPEKVVGLEKGTIERFYKPEKGGAPKRPHRKKHKARSLSYSKE